MPSRELQAIVLAAGSSKRFKTEKTKLVEKICGQEMILYITRLLHEQLNIKTTLVVGFQKEKIKTVVTKKHGTTISFVTQEKQQGTGHALLCSKPQWSKENILIINGDMPLLSKNIITELYNKHKHINAAISFIASHNSDPTLGAYGRVIKKQNCIRIVEAKEFKGDPNENSCINAGIYIVNRQFLQDNIATIQLNKTCKEFHLPDLIAIASKKKLPINMVYASFDEIRGVNNLKELWAVEQIKRAELIKHWMDHGVQFSLAQNVHIDLHVTIGAGTHIGCGVHLVNETKIGKNCKIYGFSSLSSATIEDDAIIYPHCIINNASIGKNAQIGPFAHIHTESHIEEGATIGNFVEVKKTTIGKGSKAKHLSYLGDATIGSNVNIGAGTIICNFDGKNKHQTKINDNVQVGSNNALVAPLTIEKNAQTAAGSVITEDVPENSLAIARARQVNKKDYVKKVRSPQSSSAFIAAVKIKNGTIISEQP